MNQRQILAIHRHAHTKSRLDHKRASMLMADVETAMRKIIREKLVSNEPIALDDFERANLPMDQVRSCVRRLIKSVQNAMALERA